MKRLQQYPEEDPYFKGTFLIDWTRNPVDWTRNPDVAIYFANESREGEGALWICDATATGKTLQVVTVEKILKKMSELGRRDRSLGIPLMFHPKKQIAQKRATNQDAVYMAQMDLRVDLSEVWDHLQERKRSESIFVKLVLPAGTYADCFQYLTRNGITKEFLFPE